MSSRLVQLQLFHLRLPFRQRFSLVGDQRPAIDTIIAAALLADGTVGFGQGLPVPGVTGETVETIIFNIETILAEQIGSVEPKKFVELLEIVDSLPFADEQGRIINTARCCVELALLDVYGKHFKCDMAGITGYLGYGKFTSGVGSIEAIRVTGILNCNAPDNLPRQLRLMRLFGLCDFKLKLPSLPDHKILEQISRPYLNKLLTGQMTFRVDAEGAWDIDTAIAMSRELDELGFCCMEQPLAPDDLSHWQALSKLSPIALMVDESLVTLDDANHLAQSQLVDYFNIKINKNGGLLPAIKLAQIASKYALRYQLGAVSGETGILAGAGRQFLQLVPETRFTEICYSDRLLKNDVVSRPVRFRYAGRIKQLHQPGLGVTIQQNKIRKFVVEPPRKINLA